MATENIDDIEKIKTSIADQLEDDTQRQKVEAELERAQYIDDLNRVDKKLKEEAKENGISNFSIELLGEELTAKKDLIHIKYTITEETKGEEKANKIATFVRKLMAKTELSEYFNENDVKISGEENEVGESVHMIIYRTDHEWDDIETEPIDLVGQGEEEEDGGGRGGF